MKLVLAIVFSLLLAGTPFLPAPAASSCARQPTRACCQGGVMKCCAASPDSSSRPVPAVPAQSGSHNQFSLPAPAALVWTLPASPTCSMTFATPSPLTTTGVPLFARHCVRLI